MESYTTLESGFKTMWFPCPDSLVSCEQKADWCKKEYGFKNIWIRVDVA